MKKKLMGLIICLIGFGMGFLSLLYSNEAVQSLEECTRKVVNPSIKDKKDWIFSSIGNIGIVLLIVAVITAIVLAVIRFFANSKCMQSAITIGQFVTDVILSLYITEVIIYYRNQLQQERFYTTMGDSVHIGVYILEYAVFYICISILFNRSVEKIIRKPKKDCRLSIWQVKNEQEFMEIKELVHREHFNDCYGYMKYREEPLASMQFYEMCIRDSS